MSPRVTVAMGELCKITSFAFTKGEHLHATGGIGRLKSRGNGRNLDERVGIRGNGAAACLLSTKVWIQGAREDLLTSSSVVSVDPAQLIRVG